MAEYSGFCSLAATEGNKLKFALLEDPQELGEIPPQQGSLCLCQYVGSYKWYKYYTAALDVTVLHFLLCVVFFTKKSFPSVLDEMLGAETTGKILQECQNKGRKKYLNVEDVKISANYTQG